MTTFLIWVNLIFRIILKSGEWASLSMYHRSSPWPFRLLLIVCLLLGACGGGGGGGDDDEFSIAGGIEINTNAIEFNAVRNGALPAVQTYQISWSSDEIAGIVVGTTGGNVVPAWLDIDLVGSSSPLTLELSVNSTDLGPGTYGFTMTVASGDASGFILDLINIPVDFNVRELLQSSPASIDVDYVIGQPTPVTEPLLIGGTSINWQATIDQPWASLDITTGTTPTPTEISLDPAGLPIGLNQAIVSVVDQNDPTDTLDIAVNFTISEPSIQISQASLAFAGTNFRANELAEQTIDFELTNGISTNWTATPSDPWITLDQTSWTGPASMLIGVDPDAGGLASGDYSGSVTLSTIWMGTPYSVVIPVDLNLSPATVAAFPSPLVFKGASSKDIATQTVFLSVNTFPNAYPWSLTLNTDSGGNWLESSEVSGSVSQIQATPEIGINSAGLPGGNYTGSLDFTVQVNGDALPFSIPVQLQLEDNRLIVDDNGVALVSTPTTSRLSHSVRVRENRDDGGLTPWAAVSDQAWLSVTASGLTGGDLTLTADPTGLTPDTVHYARVTLSSTEPSISSGDVIEVGFYVSNNAPAAQVTNAAPALGLTALGGLAADPIRPRAYVTSQTGVIDVYHSYTGALLSSINTGATDLRNLAISSDGQMLYALDFASGEIVNIDLDGASIVVNPAWTNSAWDDCGCATNRLTSFDYTRVKGRGILIGGGDIIDAQTGSRLFPTTANNFIGAPLDQAIADNGKLLFTAVTNSSPHNIRRYTVDYDAIDDIFALTETDSASKPSFTRGISSSPAGERLYRACWYPLSELEVYDGSDLSTLSSVSGGTNGSTLFGEDGLLYCARHYNDGVVPGVPDVWSVDPDTGAVAQEYNVTDLILQDQYRISGDGKRLITRNGSDQSIITFTSIP